MASKIAGADALRASSHSSGAASASPASAGKSAEEQVRKRLETLALKPHSAVYKLPAVRSGNRAPTLAGNRGKSAEEQIRKWLDRLALQQHNAVYRLPDARAGSRLPTLADFVLCHRATMYLLEVKEVAHDFRLPHGNFDKAQIARMKRFSMAGAVSAVLVRHSTTGLWRYVELEFFASLEGGSWDLSGVPATTLEDVFGEFL